MPLSFSDMSISTGLKKDQIPGRLGSHMQGHDDHHFVDEDDLIDDDHFWEQKITSMMAREGARNADQANEVNRVMTTFKLNPFEILNVRFDASTRNISGTYRRLAALIHPDKCSHPAAREAFERAKEAYDILRSNKTAHRFRFMTTGIKKIMLEEKEAELRKAGVGGSLVEDLLGDPKDAKERQIKADEIADRLNEWERSTGFHKEWKRRAREALVQAEWRVQRHEDYYAGAAERRKLIEREREEKKLIAKEEREKWEKHRDERIKSWHLFLRTEKEETERRRRRAPVDSADDQSETIDSEMGIAKIPYEYPDEGPRERSQLMTTYLMEDFDANSNDVDEMGAAAI
eukprot:jgi/Bigna1/135542/aug1.30_g10250